MFNFPSYEINTPLYRSYFFKKLYLFHFGSEIYNEAISKELMAFSLIRYFHYFKRYLKWVFPKKKNIYLHKEPKQTIYVDLENLERYMFKITIWALFNEEVLRGRETTAHQI